MTEQENAANCNDLEALVKTFTTDQLKYLSVRPFVRFDKEAAKAVSISPGTVSRWENKADVDEAVRLMTMDGLVVASEMLRRHLPQAAQEIVDELTHKSTDVRFRAAREVLDRGGLTTKQRHEVELDIKDVDRAIKHELAKLAGGAKTAAS